MAHGAVGEHHGSWGAGKCRSTQGRVDGEFSDQERCLRLALPSAGSAVGGRLDRHRADSRRAVAPAERGGARALGASKRHKSRERRARGHRPWPVNHSLETLTSSYVSRQTAGKPKRARVGENDARYRAELGDAHPHRLLAWCTGISRVDPDFAGCRKCHSRARLMGGRSCAGPTVGPLRAKHMQPTLKPES